MTRRAGTRHDGQTPARACLFCGSPKPPATGRTNWRSILIPDGPSYYACPAHFPPDDAGPAAFEQAYGAFMEAALRRLAEVAPGHPLLQEARRKGLF